MSHYDSDSPATSESQTQPISSPYIPSRVGGNASGSAPTCGMMPGISTMMQQPQIAGMMHGYYNMPGMMPGYFNMSGMMMPQIQQMPKQQMPGMHVRTLFFEGDPSHTKFSNFKSLHNLILDSNGCEELPDSIRELIHLRNLDISFTSIENLPGWIGELHHLQTLSVDDDYSVKLPNTLTYLINLRRLYAYSDQLPANIGRLSSLHTLPEFSVGKEKGYRIEELGSLKNLKESIQNQHLERVCDEKEAMKANMVEKPNLDELVLKWDEVDFSERNDESVLEGLRPHANLKKLTIEGYKGKRFPTWLQGEPQGSSSPLHNLIEIKLEKCEEITLDHLPNLRTLYIRELKSLKCLSKRFFYNHRNLSYLYIEGCDMLEALPDGLDTLNSLEELSIERCKNLKSMGNPSCGEGRKSRNPP